MIIVDTREPKKYYNFLAKTFPGMQFTCQTLVEGDYASEHVLVERKTVADLYGSIVGTSTKKGRFLDQVERMSLHQDQVVVLLITGSLRKYVETVAGVGVKVDPDIIYGEIGSVSCRYGFHPIWIEDEWDALVTMIKFMKKVEEGKYGLPARRDVDVLSARLLGVTVNQWRDLKGRFGSLTAMAFAEDKDLMKVYGIGEAKAKKIKSVLNNHTR